MFFLLPLGLLRAGNLTINYTSPAFGSGVNSSSVALDASFTFALGSFGAFTPTTLNEASWVANFTVVPTSGTTPWDAGFVQYSGSAVLSSNTTPFTAGSQLYVWGYNTQTIASGTEWLLLTNVNWMVASTAGTPLPLSFDASDSGTIAIVGSNIVVPGVSATLQTASIAAIPEPSTYAAIAGVLALGFVAYRRRQQAA